MLTPKEQYRVDKARWKKQAKAYRKAKRKFLKDNPTVLKGRFLRSDIVTQLTPTPKNHSKIPRREVGGMIYMIFPSGQWIKQEDQDNV
jgi:hypothetical protein